MISLECSLSLFLVVINVWLSLLVYFGELLLFKGNHISWPIRSCEVLVWELHGPMLSFYYTFFVYKKSFGQLGIDGLSRLDKVYRFNEP